MQHLTYMVLNKPAFYDALPVVCSGQLIPKSLTVVCGLGTRLLVSMCTQLKKASYTTGSSV